MATLMEDLGSFCFSLTNYPTLRLASMSMKKQKVLPRAERRTLVRVRAKRDVKNDDVIGAQNLQLV
jgi:hypothetical protein